MMILVTGGSKCGKSRIAESIAAALPLPRYYIATMQPYGEEASFAIERHRAMRATKGFAPAAEQYTDIGTADLPVGSTALLECMGNLCANEMFISDTVRSSEEVIYKILNDTDELYKKCGTLIIVTNQVAEDGIQYPPHIMEYIKALCRINAALAKKADCVIEAVCGIPVILKGEMPECLS